MRVLKTASRVHWIWNPSSFHYMCLTSIHVLPHLHPCPKYLVPPPSMYHVTSIQLQKFFFNHHPYRGSPPFRPHLNSMQVAIWLSPPPMSRPISTQAPRFTCHLHPGRDATQSKIPHFCLISIQFMASPNADPGKCISVPSRSHISRPSTNENVSHLHTGHSLPHIPKIIVSPPPPPPPPPPHPHPTPHPHPHHPPHRSRPIDSHLASIQVVSHLNPGLYMCVPSPFRRRLSSNQVTKIASLFHPGNFSNQSRSQDVRLTSLQVLPDQHWGPNVLVSPPSMHHQRPSMCACYLGLYHLHPSSENCISVQSRHHS